MAHVAKLSVAAPRRTAGTQCSAARAGALCTPCTFRRAAVRVAAPTASRSRAVKVYAEGHGGDGGPTRTQMNVITYFDSSTEYFPQWPNQPFCEQVRSEFPEKGIAHVEEARALFSTYGSIFLDIRSAYERENTGRCPGSMNIELIHNERKWDSAAGAKIVKQEANKNFLSDVAKKIPDKTTEILVVCSDGRDRAIQALELLDDNGYNNIVGIRGGFNKWFQTFDNKLTRRREDGYKEDYSGIGETACGIHGTGAGFDRMDAVEKMPWQDDTEWMDWFEETGYSWNTPPQ